MDFDDELEMLQRELMAVQEQKTNPLSDRTVAEIMVKLYHEGFAFYPTTDGNQYLTPEQLDKEIINLVRERGKINLTIIPQILNIGTDTIQSRVNFVLQKGSISRHANNLISNKYFDQMLMGLKHRLESQGKIDLEQIAIENQLNIKFIEKLVNENLELLSAQLVGNQLITKEYTLLKKSKILGFLGALNNPISLEAFIKVTGLQNRNIEETVNELVQEGRLRGKFQSSYYIPDRFTANQKKIITQFYENNGFIDSDMLQKKFLVAKPEEWLSKNLQAGSYIKIEKIYFKPEKLESFAVQTNELLKTEGFVELSHILPIQLDEKNLHLFFDQYCHLKDYFVCEGYCYSNEWLERLAAEFKEKIIYNIFFKKVDNKKEKNKKGGKKEKNDSLTEEELQQILFNCGFAEYSVAENLAPQLLPLINQKIEEMRKKIEKQLAQSKGFINSTFLKYRSGKTVLRTQQSLTRMVNIIQKQQKKQKWSDPQFGVTENDKQGQYSLVYYDNALAKGWPSLETLKWVQMNIKDLLISDGQDTHSNLKKSHLTSLLEMIDFFNTRSEKKLHQPELSRLNEQSTSPFIYEFYINEKDKRFVIVDDKLPFINQRPFGSSSKYAFAEKAYAKLRYCYKATLNVGIQQVILETTGKNSIKYLVQAGKQEKVIETLEKHLNAHDFILLLAEGQGDKKLIFEDKQIDLFSMKPYYLYKDNGRIELYPKFNEQIKLPMVVQLFKNIYVIEDK